MTAILRYNNSMAYARNVLGWAAAYATGVVPVDLPPITGPSRPRRRPSGPVRGPRTGTADERHRAARQRPAGAVAAHGADRCGRPALHQRAGIRTGQSLGPLPGPATALAQAAPQPVAPPPPAWLPPWAQPPQQQPRCAVFCITDTPAPAAAPVLPAPAAPAAAPWRAPPPRPSPRRPPARCCPRRWVRRPARSAEHSAAAGGRLPAAYTRR